LVEKALKFKIHRPQSQATFYWWFPKSIAVLIVKQKKIFFFWPAGFINSPHDTTTQIYFSELWPCYLKFLLLKKLLHQINKFQIDQFLMLGERWNVWNHFDGTINQFTSNHTRHLWKLSINRHHLHWLVTGFFKVCFVY
jgi:hypothetical protein